VTALAKDDVRDKRQATLTAARELFASQGYEETTIAEITRGRGWRSAQCSCTSRI
jgi:AcrR family transcriptional regulator